MRSIDRRVVTTAAHAAVLCLAFLAPLAAQEKPPEYAGSETCQACHEDIFNALGKSPHKTVEISSRPDWKGRACETCHGPGAAHAGSATAELIRNPAKLTAAAADRTCLTCHASSSMHSARISASHVKNEVSCVSCHKIHANGPHGLVSHAPQAINAQCTTCHAAVAAQFQKPQHHRVPEGAMSCVDCHNPHSGSRFAVSASWAGNETACFRCHADKRGPFAFEHAPVRLEGCGSCHESHGSANPRMLTRSDVSQVCLECHANLPARITSGAALGVVPPSFHDLRSPRYRNCTSCHQKIHGSHVDRNLLR